jgi:hypothetical protein
MNINVYICKFKQKFVILDSQKSCKNSTETEAYLFQAFSSNNLKNIITVIKTRKLSWKPGSNSRTPAS